MKDASPEAADFLAELPPLMVHSVVWLVGLFLLSALAWSWFSRVDVVVSAPGVVRPEGESHPVASAMEAQVEQLEVQQGDRVERGQVVAWVESRTAAEDLAMVEQARERSRRTRQEVQRELPSQLEKLREQARAEERKLESLELVLRTASRDPEVARRELEIEQRAARLEIGRRQEQLRRAALEVEEADRAVEFSRETLATHRR
ncbi:MAG: hypothetical protein AB1758_14545, partial [Candidatus Eremiobacterota bacterium]